MTHNELADDLARHLDNPSRMVWTDLQLGPRASARPDVYTLECSFERPNPRAYEVKGSRSDFLADVTRAKWSSYLSFAESVTFAVPHGLVKRTEVPEGCGLMFRSERGWSTARRAVRKPIEWLPQSVLLKLLMDGVGRQFRIYRTEQFSEYTMRRDLRDKLGAEVCEAINQREEYLAKAERVLRDAERRLEHAKGTEAAAEKRAEAVAERVKQKARGAHVELAECLGLDLTSIDEWGLRSEVRRRAALLDRDATIQHMRDELRKAREALEAVEQHWSAKIDA